MRMNIRRAFFLPSQTVVCGHYITESGRVTGGYNGLAARVADRIWGPGSTEEISNGYTADLR